MDRTRLLNEGDGYECEYEGCELQARIQVEGGECYCLPHARNAGVTKEEIEALS